MEFSETLQHEILKKLSYKSKKPPSQKTCRDRLELAACILMSIAKEPTTLSIEFATEIIRKAQTYLKDTHFPSLDKLILKILNKMYDPKLIEFIRHTEDPEIIAGVCYVKFRHLGVVDEKIFEVYEDLQGDLKNKVERLFGYEILKNNKIIKKKEITMQPMEIATQSIGVATQSIEIQTDPEKASFSRSMFYNGLSNSFDGSSDNSLHLSGTFYNILLGNPIVWNNFAKYTKSKYAVGSLLLALNLLNDNKLKDARAQLLSLISSSLGPKKQLIYSLLAYIHFLFLEFHEAVFYLDLLLEMADRYDWEFAFNCKLLLERHGKIPSLHPYVTVKFPIDIPLSTDLLINFFENKLFIKQVLRTSFERIILHSKVYCPMEHLVRFFESWSKAIPGFLMLFLFSHENKLFIYDILEVISIYTSSESPGRIAEALCVEWMDVATELDSIMQENQKILSENVATSEDKKRWWATRISLDRRLEITVLNLKKRISRYIEDNRKVLLILEDSVAFFPFEAAFSRPAMRILTQDLSLHFNTLKINSVFYLLDPSNNLQNTRSTIFEYLNSKNFQKGFLKGIVGRSLEPEEVRLLHKNELFMYFGHGTGKKHFDVPDEMPKLLFLFGCSSCRLLHTENFKANGFCLKHFKKKRILLGNLWDVTDKDLDKFTVAFLEDFFSGKDLLEAVFSNRGVCKLRYLNSAALVVYGIMPE